MTCVRKWDIKHKTELLMLDIIIACFCLTTFKTKHCIHHIQVHVARLRTATSTI